MDEEKQKYTWEEKYKLDLVQENVEKENGVLVINKKQIAVKREDRKRIKRGLIRHTFIILDMSVSMADFEFVKPSCLSFCIQLLKVFISDYYDQNPISQLGIMYSDDQTDSITKEGMANLLSPLSSNPTGHLTALEAIRSVDLLKGEPSLQNALELARVSLSHVPQHSSKEVLILMASLTTRDPSDITNTIIALAQDNITCNCVSLYAQLGVCKRLCQATHGICKTPMDADHMKEIMIEMLIPPAKHRSGKMSQRDELIEMAFPILQYDQHPTLCACHGGLTSEGYICPECHSKLCSVPMDCPVCGVKNVDAMGLGRSWHHLFPVPQFEVVDLMETDTALCFGCNRLFSEDYKDEDQVQVWGCKQCTHLFCNACDLFIHNVLHNCPGCV